MLTLRAKKDGKNGKGVIKVIESHIYIGEYYQDKESVRIFNPENGGRFFDELKNYEIIEGWIKCYY